MAPRGSYREVEVYGERDEQKCEHGQQQSEIVGRQLAHVDRMAHVRRPPPSGAGGTPSRARVLIGWGREATTDARLILAAKTAVAAAIAWYLAPLVPWADSEYSYYAPLGVLVSMYPTLAGSARAGAQALIGLAIGIGLGLGGLALLTTDAPGVVAVAAVIAVGIALGGIGALGVGRDWVAIAGLFVLLIGGPTGGEFTLSYLLTMAFGVVVGVLMNLIAVPPLYLRRASGQLTLLRERVGRSLEEIAAAMTSDPQDRHRIADAVSGLPRMLSSVDEEVRTAEESSRGNPRIRNKRKDQELNARRMTALERTATATRDLATILDSAADEDAIGDAGGQKVAEAVRACAELVAAPVDDPEARYKLDMASEALDAAADRLNQQHPRSVDSSRYAPAYAYAALVCVRRILSASKDFVSPA